MAGPMDPKKVTAFDAAYLRDGQGVAAAARRAGVGESWAYSRVAKLKRDGVVAEVQQKAATVLSGPIPYGALNSRARRAHDDFEFFRRVYLGHISTPWQVEAAQLLIAALARPGRDFIVINEPPGAGKALALDTPIATPDGWTTMKDIEPGDRVFDENGDPCAVVAKSEVFYGHDCYEVTTDDGASVIADADHLWRVRLGGHGQYGSWTVKADRPGKTGPKPSPDGRHLHTTRDLAKPRNKRPQLQVAAALRLPDVDVPIDPYVLGYWLGDGNSMGAQITVSPDDMPHLLDELTRAAYTTTVREDKTAMRVRFSQPVEGCLRGHNNYGPGGRCRDCDAISRNPKRDLPPVTTLTPQGWLRHLGLLGNKHIPDLYLRASEAQRLALLQGLVDSDGHVAETGRVEFTTTSRRLARDVTALVRSLGVKASCREGRATLDGRDCGARYRICFYRADAARLPRKAGRCRDGERTPSRYLTVTPCESVPTQCIQVDSPSSLYLAGEGLMVTHNSTLVRDLAIWLTVRNRGLRGLMGSGTFPKATRMLGPVRRALERTMPVKASDEEKRLGIACDAEATLAQDFGLFKPLDNSEPWRSDALMVVQPNYEVTTEKEHTWMAYGLDSDYLGDRLDVMLWDDAVLPRDYKTAERIEERHSNFDTVTESRLEPDGVLLLIGQRINANDLYRHCLDKVSLPDDDLTLDELEALSDDERALAYDGLGRKYQHIVYPAHFEEKCEGVHNHEAKPWPDGCLLDPYRIKWRELRDLKHNDPATYETWYQQKDTDPSDVLVKKVWVEGGTDPQTGTLHYPAWDATRDLCELPRDLRGPLFSYVTVDPSPEKYWGVQWWVYAPNAEHSLFLMDLYKGKLRADQWLDWQENDKCFTGLAQEWQTRSEQIGPRITHWIVEHNGAQRFMLQTNATQRWIAHHGINLIPHTTALNKNDPQYGVYMLREPWRTGRVRLPRKTEAARLTSLKLVDEVCRYPHGWYDDQVMSMWFGYSKLSSIAIIPDSQHSHLERPSWASGLDARSLVAVGA